MEGGWVLGFIGEEPIFIIYREFILSTMGSTALKKQLASTQEEDKLFVYKEMIKTTTMTNPETHYRFIEKIGEGNYAEVFKVQSLITGQIRVIKKVQRKGSPALGRHLFNEFDILRQLDHPNIIKMFEMFQDQSHHYIVSQYLPGKDALDLLISLKHIKEDMAFNIFYNCLLALNNLHKNKIMHRDIKLENIIYDQETMCFKLIDFGSALRYSSAAPRERRSTGTIHYMAPEVINKYYNMKCDVWSLGILLYVLLCGNGPFMGETSQEVMQKTLKEAVSFEKQVWQTRSKESKSLISRMLDKNFERRPSIVEILKDPWVVHNNSLKKMHKAEVEQTCISLERMMKFRKIQPSDIQLGILLFMINFITKLDNQVALIRSFLKIDQQGDGDIDEKELKAAFREYLHLDCKTADAVSKEVIAKIDLNGSKDISYSQFMLGATDLRQVITHQNIAKTFQYIDTDNSQAISMKQLQARLGDHLDENQYKRLVNLFDSDGDGEIDLVEFSKMMTDLLEHY